MRQAPLVPLLASLAVLLVAGLSFLWFDPAGAGAAGPPRLETKLVRWDETAIDRGKWGEFRRFFAGEGYGADRLLAGVGVIRAGQALHRAHRHAEEEFLVVASGEGTWNVGGKEVPLRAGDVLYVEPWVEHGFVNSGSEPLTFFVARWRGKGVEPAPRPAEP